MNKVILALLLLAFFTLTPPVLAFDPILIASPIPSKPFPQGLTFFFIDLTINYTGGNIIFSQNADGTGGTAVDDVADIIITEPDGSLTTKTISYYNNCSFISEQPPQNVTDIFKIGINKVRVRLRDVCGSFVGSSQLYLVNQSNQPQAPTPFLDLPWDYQSKGLSFNEAANDINSYFDHQYPLLSSGLGEPSGITNSLIYFRGGSQDLNKSYSSHDGYDYGKPAKANFGDPVLAAAGGKAQYVNSCTPCGNMVEIDHGNGYQTRYMHMQPTGLITNTPGQIITVTAGQPIGKIGATGNVIPAGEPGAHIHFMVVQDKNHDGNFDDNIPDGVADPFGWQSTAQDPWPIYSFVYAGKNRTGNISFYLWKKKIDNLDATLTSNGGVFKPSQDSKFSVNIPQGTITQNAELILNSSPNITIGNLFSSLGSALQIRLQQDQDHIITNLSKIISITSDFSGIDLLHYKLDTLSFYSSSDGQNWTKENTTVDLNNKTATTQVQHLTYFALVGERLDTTAPTTIANLTGDQGQPNWFRSDVNISLNAADNDGGLGVDYTLYSLDGDLNWPKYDSPILVSKEGHHKIQFYSVDNDENIEDPKTIEFDIDKTPPTTTAIPESNLSNGWSPGNKITLLANDNFGIFKTEYNLDSLGWQTYSTPINIPSRTHNLIFHSIDKAGNQDVDKNLIPPDLNLTTGIEETGTYHSNQIIHYLVTVTNNTGFLASSSKILVMDRLPAGAVFQNATGEGSSCTYTLPDVSCEHGPIGPGEQFTIRIEVVLPTRLPGGGLLQNQTEVDPKNTIPETNESNNKSQLTIRANP